MLRIHSLLRRAAVMVMLLPVLISCASPGAALAAIELASGAPPGPSPAIIAPDCPVGAEQLSSSGGLAVCVDRGEGATYKAGDRIVVCASANIPTIAIYPPPPPPTIRVESVGPDGKTRVLLEDRFADGHRCLTGTIAPPFGHETVRVTAIRPDGPTFLEDGVSFTTEPR